MTGNAAGALATVALHLMVISGVAEKRNGTDHSEGNNKRLHSDGKRMKRRRRRRLRKEQQQGSRKTVADGEEEKKRGRWIK